MGQTSDIEELENPTFRYGCAPRFQLNYRDFCTLRQITQFPPAANQITSRFACHLAIHLPEVAARINEEIFGNLPAEVSVLNRTTKDAILAGDWFTVAQFYSFVDNLYHQCGTELRQELDAGFLGKLFYGETSENFAKARLLLPSMLSDALGKVENKSAE